MFGEHYIPLIKVDFIFHSNCRLDLSRTNNSRLVSFIILKPLPHSFCIASKQTLNIAKISSRAIYKQLSPKLNLKPSLSAVTQVKIYFCCFLMTSLHNLNGDFSRYNNLWMFLIDIRPWLLYELILPRWTTMEQNVYWLRVPTEFSSLNTKIGRQHIMIVF